MGVMEDIAGKYGIALTNQPAKQQTGGAMESIAKKYGIALDTAPPKRDIYKANRESKNSRPIQSMSKVDITPTGYVKKDGKMALADGYEFDEATGFAMPTTKTVLNKSAIDEVGKAALYGAGASYLNTLSTAANSKDLPDYLFHIDEVKFKEEHGLPLRTKGLIDLFTTKEDIQKKADALLEKSQKETLKAKEGKSKAEQYLIDLGIGGLHLGTDIALNALMPGAGTANLATRAFGGGSQQARLAGADEGQAAGYGLLSTATELLTEKIANFASPLAKTYGKGLIDSVIGKTIGKLTSSKAGKATLGLLASAVSEGAEEVIAGAVDPILKKLTYDPNALKEYKDPEFISDLLYEGLIGGSLGMIAGSGQFVGSLHNNNAPIVSRQETRQNNAAKTVAVDPIQSRSELAIRKKAFAEMGDYLNNVQTEADPETINRRQLAEQMKWYNAEAEAIATAEASNLPFEVDTADVTDIEQNAEIDEINSDIDDFADIDETYADNDLYYEDYDGGVEKYDTTDEYLAEVESEQEQERFADDHIVYNENTGRYETDKAGIDTNANIDPYNSIYEQLGDTNSNKQGIPPTTNTNSPDDMYVYNQEHSIDPWITEEARKAGLDTGIHKVLTAEQRAKQVAEIMKNGAENAQAYLLNKEVWTPADAIAATKVLRALQKTINAESIEKAMSWKAEIEGRQTQWGQYGKALSDLSKHTPENIVSTAMDVIADIEGQLNKSNEYKEVAKLTRLTEAAKQEAINTAMQEYADNAMIQRVLEAALTNDQGSIFDTIYFAAIENGMSIKEATGLAAEVEGYVLDTAHSLLREKIENGFRGSPETKQAALSYLQKLKDIENGAIIIKTKTRQLAEAELGYKGGIKDPDNIKLLAEIKEYAEQADKISDNDYDSIIAMIKKLNAKRGTAGLFTKKTSRQMSAALESVATHKDMPLLRAVLESQIRSLATDNAPIGAVTAVKSVRITGMLSKASTTMRNLVGNMAHGTAEVSSSALAVPFDAMFSKWTNNRSVAAYKGVTSAKARKAAAYAANCSFIEVGLDVDVSGVNSKFEQSTGRVFKMSGNPLERLLSTFQKYSNYSLVTSDEAFKGLARTDAQEGIDKLKQQGKLDTALLNDRADQIAKEVTFQDDSAISNALLKARELANKIPFTSISDKYGGRIGLGDLAMPFVKVPANVTMAAINYSPIGLAKSTVQLANAIDKAKNGNLTIEQQAKVSMDLGRGLTGTAGMLVMLLGAFKGWLRFPKSDDKDEKALMVGQGLNTGKLNVSAMQRSAENGNSAWQDGDYIVSLDFLETFGAQLSLAALLYQAYEKDKRISAIDLVALPFEAGIEALKELPAISQIQDIMNTYKYSQGKNDFEKTADTALSFMAGQTNTLVPNVVKGIAQGADAYIRSPYQADSLLEKTKNQWEASIPGLRKNVPIALDSWGRERTYTDNNLLNILNSNLLPARLTSYRTDDVTEEMLKQHTAPDRAAPNRLKIDGENVKLTTEQKREYQKEYGAVAYKYLDELIKANAYKNASDEEKQAAIAKIYDMAEASAKNKVAGYAPNSAERWITYANYANKKTGLSVADYIFLSGKIKDIEGVPKANGTGSIAGSASLKKMAELYGMTNLTDEQRKYLYTQANGSKKYIDYSYEQVMQELYDMGAFEETAVAPTMTQYMKDLLEMYGIEGGV